MSTIPPVVSSRAIQADSCRAKAFSLLEKDIFTREDSARAESLLHLAEQLDTAGKAQALRRASLTEAEASAGYRTPRTRALDEVRENFLQALRWGADTLPDSPQKRALSVGTDSAGGFLVPAGFAGQLFVAMKNFDALFDPNVTTVLESANGGTFPVPLFDDTASSATIIAENAQLASTPDAAFEQLLLQKASSWKSSMIRVSMELAQDSFFDLETLLANAFGVRLARGIGANFYGVLIAAATKGADAAATAITPENIFDMVDSIDAYLGPKCCWLMRRATLNYLRKLKTAGNNYAFPLDRDQDGHFLLCDFPVRVSPSVAAIGTGAKSIVFGDLSYFCVRRVTDSLRVRRFAETFAEYAQLGFMSYIRCNAGLAKASTADSPCKYLLHA